jgi:hypothetical protein
MHQLIEFNYKATESRFWVFWIRNTIKKAATVVPVLLRVAMCRGNEK